ncbi:unnamed protein product [Hyaloperonospora brassicae]|uniref:Uncharacterized protein n=1 Tax=Hyaloperonospora brassicae TaxID=162125 RepID=A0AAV0US49_HYABA|nr:unnamed protein product [Hyaloperonospora brassicae]
MDWKVASERFCRSISHLETNLTERIETHDVELSDLTLGGNDYVEFLRKMMTVSEQVQNVSGLGLVRTKTSYAPLLSRAMDETLALVGAHMDVVPANPEGW